MEIGDALPDVTLVAEDGTPLPLAVFAGAPLVLYFYPKDDTAGCTREAQDFSALAGDFAAAGVQVLGVSKDAPARHASFRARYALTVALASDEDAAAAEAFGVWGERSLYGRRYMGVERATFLFDAGGRLAQTWRRVRVAGHAEAVLAAARAL